MANLNSISKGGYNITMNTFFELLHPGILSFKAKERRQIHLESLRALHLPEVGQVRLWQFLANPPQVLQFLILVLDAEGKQNILLRLT